MVFGRRGTRIVIKALTPKGVKSLKEQKAADVDIRAEHSVKRRKDIPKNLRSYLKTVSAYMPKQGDPKEHQILGFGSMSMPQKASFYEEVKKSFLDDGCDLDDFEVKFYDG